MFKKLSKFELLFFSVVIAGGQSKLHQHNVVQLNFFNIDFFGRANAFKFFENPATQLQDQTPLQL